MIIITRKLIADRIEDLLKGQVTCRVFGEEMFYYMAFEGEKYEYEKGYESLIREVIDEFMDMHDADQGDVGYEPYIPSKERLEDLRKKLLNE